MTGALVPKPKTPAAIVRTGKMQFALPAGGAGRKSQLPYIPRDRITAYLLNGGTIENAQAIAAHESPRTTKLYDRTSDEITLDEVERIGI